MARETLGVGTLTAFAVSLPTNSGSTCPTALPAPVSVMTIFRAALLPRLSFLWKLSIKF